MQLAGLQYAALGPLLVAKLGLDLVEVQGQLLRTGREDLTMSVITSSCVGPRTVRFP